jgi:hypothetical protein
VPRSRCVRSVTVLGECVADAFTDPDRPSADELALRALPCGGPANTAVALARLGTPTRFLGRFSTDVFGALFHARVSASGVDLTGSVTAAPEPSTLTVADLDDSGQATGPGVGPWWLFASPGKSPGAKGAEPVARCGPCAGIDMPLKAAVTSLPHGSNARY